MATKNIIVYSTPTCPYCNMVKQFLREQNIPFEDVDVTKDEQRLREMVEKSHQMGVPVIDIDGTIIIGFDKQRIEAALKE